MKNTDLTSPQGPYPVLSIMGFAMLGMFSLGLACAVLLVDPAILTGDPVRGPVLAFTHMVTLGWIGSMLFAGAYLVGPTLAGNALWSLRAPLWHLAFHVPGLTLLVVGLWIKSEPAAGVGGGLLCIGLVLLILNVKITGNIRSLWTPPHLAFQAAMFWLAVTGAVALYMLRNRTTNESPLPAETLIAFHAHYALFGFLTQALLGVSLGMIPRLLDREDLADAPQGFAWTGWILLNAGLVLLFPATIFASPPILLGTGILFALGVCGFVIEVLRMLWRASSTVSWGTITHACGVLLLLGIVVGALIQFPRVTVEGPGEIRVWMQMYIALALLGPFAFIILGSGERVVPVLVWNLRFRPWQDHAEVPPPISLRQAGAGGPVFFSLILAWVYLAIGQIQARPEAIRLGAILFLVAFAWYVVGVSPALLRFLLGVTPRELGKLHT